MGCGQRYRQLLCDRTDRTRKATILRLTAMAAMAGVLAGCGATVSNRPTGSYETHVPGKAGDFGGQWTITFARNGDSSVLKHNGVVFANEQVSFQKSSAFFKTNPGPNDCPGYGTYGWKLAGTRLQFTADSETCPVRSVVLDYPLTRR